MRLLALDVATNVGWARAEDNGAPQNGTYALPSTGENYGLRMARFRDWLDRTVTAFEPHVIGFESPIHKPQDKLHKIRILYTLAGVVELVGWDRSVKVFEDGVSGVRSHFLGKGYAKLFVGSEAQKLGVIAECRARGWEPADHNAADALALLDLMRHHMLPGFNSRTRFGLARVAA